MSSSDTGWKGLPAPGARRPARGSQATKAPRATKGRGKHRGEPPSETPVGQAPPAAAGLVRQRHAAITRNLQTWASYQTWAEQVRDTWDQPDGLAVERRSPARTGAGEGAPKGTKK